MAILSLEAQSRQLNTEIASKFRGTAKISLECLLFDPEEELDRRKTDHLVRIFKQGGCDRLNPNHFIPGVISQDVLRASLEKSNLDAQGLQSPQPPTLVLPPGTRVKCLQGRHRIEALRRLTHLATWWTIKLYVGKVPCSGP